MLVKSVLTSVCAVALAMAGPVLADDDEDRRHGHRHGHKHHRMADFQPLSVKHLLYGVSQFSHGHVSDSRVSVHIKLNNPNIVTQAVAALVYTRGKSDDVPATVLGAFGGCVVKVLPARGSLGIVADEVPPVPAEFSIQTERRYVELIWAPTEPVRVRGKRRGTRLADGLGGTAREGSTNNAMPFVLTHPSRFSLPSNDIVPGQREAAIDCLCQGLAENDAPPDTFGDFGVADCATETP